MRVFVTGASGYVGSAIVSELLQQGYEVTALVRNGSTISAPSIRAIEGDLLRPQTYEAALADCDAVIHLVGIIREQPSGDITFDRLHVQGTRAIVEACQRVGFIEGNRRFIHMSALGARSGATTGYFRTKWEAENVVRDSGLTHLIFRPSVIFGPQDEFVNMLAGLVNLPLTPVIGDGKYRLQPVSLYTVAELFVKAVNAGPTNAAFDVGGPEQISYNEMLREIGRAVGRNVTLAHAPLALMRPIVQMMDRFPFFPITMNQLTMLLEENICREGTPFYDTFGLQPIRFAEGIREYLKP
jgi:uncharacterized protein YbjT (DUF2867 family)